MRRALSIGLTLLMAAGGIAVLAPAPPAAATGHIEAYMTGLNFPIALAFSSDGRTFFAEKDTGSIRVIERGTLLTTPFYTLPNTDNAGERGLLGLALDPGFPSAPYVYAYQTYNDVTNGTTYNRIVRIVASGNTGVSYTVILRLPPLSTATIHNGGVIAFGPDGTLYAVVGENGNPSLAQDPLSPMGKVLRMNSDGTVPPDNPFANDPSWDPLVFTYGHRNMFGIAFHPVTGRVFLTENGPACNDEINLLTAGANYGWGPSNTCSTPPPAPNNTNRDGPNPVLPIWWWGSTICPTNAAIYAGPYFPSLQGDLFMGDCNYGRFHRLHLIPPNYDKVESDEILWTAPTMIVGVEDGLDGAIWLTTPSTIYRYAGQPPIASFTTVPNPILVRAPETFNASASYDPDGTIVSYAWDFGDTSTGSGSTASHSYGSAGTFNVTLTVTDNDSFTAKTYRDVVVQAQPIASFTATPNPAFVRENVTFDASASTDPDGTIVSYAWNFGDQSFGSGRIALHSYTAIGTYNVTLNVTDNDAFNGTAHHDVVVQTPPPGPVARFTVGPSPTTLGSLVTFNASTSFDSSGTIVSYAWDFGDSTGGTGVTVAHAYANPGMFTANLTIVDNRNLSSNAMHQVTIDAPPIAAFQFSPTTIYIGVIATFDGSSSTDSDGTIASYAWDFGDQSTGTGVRVSHTYAAKGILGVELIVVDNLGFSNRATRAIQVQDRAPQILSSTPGLGPVTVPAGGTRTFSVVGWDPDGDALSYAWRIDGAVVANGNSSAFDFSAADPGTHIVNVTVSDGTLTGSRQWKVAVAASGFQALISSWPFVVLVAAIIAGAFLLWMMRRRRRPEAPPPGPR